MSKGIKTSKHFINDDKVSDHHAIIPTQKTPKLNEFVDDPKKGISKDDLQKIYDLVVRRFIAVFYPAAQYEKTEVVTEVEGETFKTSGKVLVFAGWKEIYGADLEEEDEEEDVPKKGKNADEKVKVVKLPPIANGEDNLVTDIDMQSKQTKPPTHFTEGGLIGIMEDPRRLLDDESLKEAMKEANAGLGTQATRQDIIENIIKRGYVERKGKSLIATDLAEKLISIAPLELKSPEITAEWEQKLMDMEKSKIKQEAFEAEIREYITKNISELKDVELTISFGHVNDGEVVGKCPTCQLDVKEKKSVFACDTQDCFVVFKEMAKKKISAAQVKQLLSKGETAELKGFKNKAGKAFAAKLVIKEGKVTFGFSDQKNEALDYSCPKCNGKMIDKGNLIACENSTQESRCLTIFKTISSKKITDKQVEVLVTKGETDLIDGFKSKTGNAFSAKLILKDGKVEFAFENITCPFCGGNVIENAKAFGCSNWREKNCKFSVWKVMMGKKMTKKIVNELIENKKTKKMDGFKSKAGKEFSASLVLNTEEKKIDLSFD